MKSSGMSTPRRSAGEDAARVYFGLGLTVELINTTRVFQMTEAGRFFGRHIVSVITDKERTGSVLEIGTGSGALAILLKMLGCHDVTATDIDREIVAIARRNARRNLTSSVRPKGGANGTGKIDFLVSDLFEAKQSFRQDGRDRKWDLIVFNAPGWQTPTSEKIRTHLRKKLGLLYNSRFEGDKIVKRFASEVPRFLKPHGRILLAVNSLVGVRSILDNAGSAERRCGPLKFRFVAQMDFELVWHSDDWMEHRETILSEFKTWRRSYGASFMEKEGRIFFTSEIIEASFAD